MKRTCLNLGAVATITVMLAASAGAALVVDLSAGSGTDTTVDGALVSTWDDGTTTFTRASGNARYVANSGNGIPAIEFDRSAPFLGDITAANGSSTIGDATILVWANFDGYTHSAGSSSYYFSIDGSGNEHTLGRDADGGGPNAIYHWDGGGATYGAQSPAGWNLYIVKFYGSGSIVGSVSAEAWIDSVGDGAVVTGAADLTNSDNIAYNGNANSVRIGTWTSGGSGLDGQIRALQIYNTILTDMEIQAAALGITGGGGGTALVVDLSADSGTDTTVDGALVSTWDDGTTTFTRASGTARYVADSGDGIPAIEFDRSAPFLGDITTNNGSTIIGNATVLVWANFDGYSHGAGSSSYYFSIDGPGNEHTLGRDEDGGGPNALYHWDGGGPTYGAQSPAGWNLYIAKFYGSGSIVGSVSAEAWIDSVGDGAVVTGAADLTNSDNVAYSGNANSVRIGTWTNGGSGLDGRIRALQIYNAILTDTEIQAAAQGITGVGIGTVIRFR